MSNKSILHRSLAILLVFVTVSLVSGAYLYASLRSGKSASISMAVELNDHSAAAWVALRKGWFEEEGLNVTNLTTFQSGLEVATAMARGDVQVAWVCLGPALMMYSSGVPIKILAMTHLNGYAIVARPEIADVSQLSGKPVAASGPGTPTWLLLQMVIEKYNLSGVRVMKMPPYSGLNALLSGQVAAASLPEHLATIAEVSGMRVLLRSQDVWPDMPGSVLAVREDFLVSSPEAALKLVRLTAKAIDFINANFEESARIVASSLGVDEELMLRSMRNLNFTTSIDIRAVQEYADLLYKFGALESPLRVDGVVDLTYLREAGG